MCTDESRLIGEAHLSIQGIHESLISGGRGIRTPRPRSPLFSRPVQSSAVPSLQLSRPSVLWASLLGYSRRTPASPPIMCSSRPMIL